MKRNLKPGWQLMKFGDVVRNANLVERDPVGNGIEQIVGLEHLDPENLHIRRWNSSEDATSFSRKFVPGQTLFGKRRAYQRKVAYAEFEGICSGDILTFETRDRNILLPELLPFICQSESFFDYALGTSAGSLSPRTSWTALSDFEFPLPPLDEQKRISEILWAADEAVEKLLGTHKSAIKLLESLRNNDICSKNIPRKKLGMVLQSIVAGKSVNGVNTPAKSNEFGVLKVSAVGANGFKPEENKRLINSSDFFSQYSVKKNVLLITRCNTTELVGRVCLTNHNYPNLMLCDKTLQLNFDERKVNTLFIFEVLRSRELRTQLMGCATGTGGAMKNISQQDIRLLLVPMPPLKEQEQIADQVLAIGNRIEEIHCQIDKLRNVATQLSNDLMRRNVSTHV